MRHHDARKHKRNEQRLDLEGDRGNAASVRALLKANNNFVQMACLLPALQVPATQAQPTLMAATVTAVALPRQWRAPCMTLQNLLVCFEAAGFPQAPP